MKTLLVVVVTAIIVFSITSLGQAARTAKYRAWLVSEVKMPGRLALLNIESDFESGKIDRAKAKVAALRVAWEEFISGPDTPSAPGIGQIMLTFREIDERSQTPNPEPSSGGNP